MAYRMRIHLSAAFLLGSIAVATADIVCRWQDAGYTYYADTADDAELLASCCESCPDIESGGCLNGYYMCDGAAPGVNVECAAAQATTPGQWFTTPEQLYQYIRDSTTCSDVSMSVISFCWILRGWCVWGQNRV